MVMGRPHSGSLVFSHGTRLVACRVGVVVSAVFGVTQGLRMVIGRSLLSMVRSVLGSRGRII